MFTVTRDFYIANQTVIDLIPARTTAFTLLGTNITAINAIVASQSSNISGVTTDKKVLRNNLDTLSIGIFAPALVWAKINQNNTLAAEFDYTLNDIQKVKDDSIVAFLTHRYSLINPPVPSIADYGITPALLTAWQAAMTAFQPIIATPRSARVSKKVYTSQLSNLFQATNVHLRDTLDNLMLPFRTQNRDLYLGYRSSRIIIDRRGPGTSTPTTPPTPTVNIKINGTVAGNMFPLPNASITVTVGATNYPTIAGAAGIYAVSIPNPTVSTDATITASAPNFTPETRNITLEPNQNQTQDFNLTSAPPMP
jgi:hypothetical protein